MIFFLINVTKSIKFRELYITVVFIRLNMKNFIFKSFPEKEDLKVRIMIKEE